MKNTTTEEQQKIEKVALKYIPSLEYFSEDNQFFLSGNFASVCMSYNNHPSNYWTIISIDIRDIKDMQQLLEEPIDEKTIYSLPYLMKELPFDDALNLFSSLADKISYYDKFVFQSPSKLIH